MASWRKSYVILRVVQWMIPMVIQCVRLNNAGNQFDSISVIIIALVLKLISEAKAYTQVKF